MPEKRNGHQWKVMIGGCKFFLRTTDREDGRLSGVIMDLSNADTATCGAVRAFADAVTVGLERGVPLEEYVSTFLNTSASPSGEVLGYDPIRFTSSIYDFVARALGMRYLGRSELAINSFEELSEQLALQRALTHES